MLNPAPMAYTFDNRLRASVADNLARFERAPVRRPELKRAAVAVTLVEQAGTAAFLLTRRAARLNAHAGQWALPGGRLDSGETEEEAARRELHEELGLDLPASALLGLLDDYPTRSGYLITPALFWAGDAADLAPNPHEVAAVHRIPLAELDRPDSPEFVTIPESDRPVIRVRVRGSQIHAPTAAVIYQFREVALHGRPTRVAHYEQPVWAWR